MKKYLLILAGTVLFCFNQANSQLSLSIPHNILLPVNQKLIFADYIGGNISVLTRQMLPGETAQDYMLIQYAPDGTKQDEVILAEGIQ